MTKTLFTLIWIFSISTSAQAYNYCTSGSTAVKEITKATTAVSPTAKENAHSFIRHIDQMIQTMKSFGLRNNPKEKARRLLTLNQMSKSALTSQTSFLTEHVPSCDIAAQWKTDLNEIDKLIRDQRLESQKKLMEQLQNTKKSIQEGVST